ncbi:hypothetical protein C5688_03160 [Methylocystis sp. MitZ-2018]|nr:hypothetical protein C5688_03160 [Methylocystis sp. MitZ-2018]
MSPIIAICSACAAPAPAGKMVAMALAKFDDEGNARGWRLRNLGGHVVLHKARIDTRRPLPL